MLVLTRKLQERIRIGDNVTITVLRVKGNAVRIGIEAPREVRVVRAELPRDGEAVANGGTALVNADEESGSAEHLPRPSEEADAPLTAENELPPASSPRRLPQRRMINRYGAPPLRLACTHALAGSETV